MTDEPSDRIVSLDRIEGDRAILVDDRDQVEIPADWLPPDAEEGSALRLTLELAPDAQRELAERIRRLQAGHRRDENIDL